jgi:hypothetical protein
LFDGLQLMLLLRPQALKTYLEDDSVRIGRATSVAAAAAIQEYVRLLTVTAAKNARENGDSVLRASHVHDATRALDL